MPKYKLKIEYKGKNYHGMQKQQNLKTVQGEIENAIYQYLQQNIEIDFAGRTDKGVNATGQIVHFVSQEKLQVNTIKNAINFYLHNEDIRVLNVEEVSDDFHARLSAKSRTYIYKILNRKEKTTFQDDFFLYPYNIDIDLMKQGAEFLIGKHNFNSFRSSGCQSASPIKTINYIDIYYNESSFNEKEIYIKLNAKSFLHQMVRIIVGTLLLVGRKKITPEDIKTILSKEDRKFAGQTAPPNALFLVNVEY